MTADDVGTEYHKLIKRSSYEYRFTNKALNSFLSYMNSNFPKDEFEQGCKQYSLNTASKDVSLSFEELLNALLNMKANK